MLKVFIMSVFLIITQASLSLAQSLTDEIEVCNQNNIPTFVWQKTSDNYEQFMPENSTDELLQINCPKSESDLVKLRFRYDTSNVPSDIYGSDPDFWISQGTGVAFACFWVEGVPELKECVLPNTEWDEIWFDFRKVMGVGKTIVVEVKILLTTPSDVTLNVENY